MTDQWKYNLFSTNHSLTRKKEINKSQLPNVLNVFNVFISLEFSEKNFLQYIAFKKDSCVVCLNSVRCIGQRQKCNSR